jgi:hypothetical protein
MSFEEAGRPPIAPRYKDEDTSPTTARELNGWYSYAVAAEVFAVVGVGKLRQIILLSDINNDHLKIHKTHADIYTFKALFYP